MTPELGRWLGGHVVNRPNAGAEKGAGRCPHGLLLVSEQDPRLSWPERELVRQLGMKLYGARPEDGR